MEMPPASLFQVQGGIGSIIYAVPKKSAGLPSRPVCDSAGACFPQVADAIWPVSLWDRDMIRPKAVICCFLLTAATAEAAPKAAVFDCQLSNLDAQPPTQADQDRLPRVSDELRQEFNKSGLYDIVSTVPLKEKVEKSAKLRSCGGCAVKFAKELGADFAITCEIQKVSNLILNFNVYIKEIGANAPEKSYSVDMRGDTDESFDRAVKYIVQNNILGK
jgi:hypothetical protein